MHASELQALEQMLRASPKGLTVAQQREAYDALGDRFPLAHDVHCEALALGGVAAERTITPNAASRTVLYLHGGGYVYGSIKSHRHLASEIGRAAAARAIALDYRRAPEAPFPAALDDAVAAWRALLELGTPLALAGDSAGGGLAVALMVRLRELGLPQPACCGLLSPWVDMLAAGESYSVNAARDAALSREVINSCARHYIGNELVDDPLASPVRANLQGIAPLTIFAGSTEVLLDDSIQLARQAGLADVPARLEIWPGMFHRWPLYHPMLAEGRTAIALIGSIMRAAFDQVRQ